MNDPLRPLAPLLADLPTSLRPSDSPQAFVSKNGWSGATFLLWHSDHGPLILKIWPSDGPTRQEHLARHRYLTALSGFQPRLALPLANSTGSTLHASSGGRWAELLPWLEGRRAEKPSQGQLAAAITTLARLHKHWAAAQPTFQQPSDAVTRRLNQLRKLKQCNALGTVIPTRIGHAPPMIREKFLTICDLSRWLLDHALPWLERLQNQNYATQVVLRDARPDHFLFTGDKLNGLIDFGAMGVDSVAADLARLLNDWFPDDKALYKKALNLYQTERPLADHEIALIPALAMSGSILGGLAWIDLHFVKGRTLGREEEFEKALDHAIKRLRSHTLQ